MSRAHKEAERALTKRMAKDIARVLTSQVGPLSPDQALTSSEAQALRAAFTNPNYGFLLQDLTQDPACVYARNLVTGEDEVVIRTNVFLGYPGIGHRIGPRKPTVRHFGEDL